MKKHIPWLAAAAIIVVIFGTIYGAVQQSQRNAGDVPQVQMAEDTAASLNNFIPPNMLVSGHVNMAASLAPFTIIYSKTGQPLESSGYLNGEIPKVPFGVLQAADNKPYHRVTWQPQSDVRIAAVAIRAKDYYVLSGRNMREVEHDEWRTVQVVSFGCAVTLAILSATYVMMNAATGKKRKTTTSRH